MNTVVTGFWCRTVHRSLHHESAIDEQVVGEQDVVLKCGQRLARKLDPQLYLAAAAAMLQVRMRLIIHWKPAWCILVQFNARLLESILGYKE